LRRGGLSDEREAHWRNEELIGWLYLTFLYIRHA
jgi:hypothetical protein